MKFNFYFLNSVKFLFLFSVLFIGFCKDLEKKNTLQNIGASTIEALKGSSISEFFPSWSRRFLGMSNFHTPMEIESRNLDLQRRTDSSSSFRAPRVREEEETDHFSNAMEELNMRITDQIRNNLSLDIEREVKLMEEERQRPNEEPQGEIGGIPFIYRLTKEDQTRINNFIEGLFLKELF